MSALSELQVGQHGILVALELPESVQNHLMHMGFVPSSLVTVVRRAPAGDPTVYLVDGIEIALRRDTADAIRVKVPRTLSRQEEAELLASARHAAESAQTAQDHAEAAELEAAAVVGASR